jgi:MFS transporter, AAHS family, 4-hydroxybenzoate transporter
MHGELRYAGSGSELWGARTGWLTFALCCTVAFLDGADSQAMAIAAPAFARTIGITPGALGILFSISLAGATVGALSCLMFANSWGPRRTLIACTTVFGGFQVASGFASDYSQLVLARLFAGVGLGGANASFLALAAVTLAPARRGTMLSILWSFFPLGGLVGGIVNGWLVQTHGWSTMFVVGGILPLPVAALMASTSPTGRAHAPSSVTTEGQLVRTLGGDRVLRTRTMVLAVVFFGAFGTLAGIGVWIPSLLAAQGFSVVQGGRILSWHALGALISMAVAGKFTSAMGSRILTIGLAASAVALVLLGLSLSNYRQVATAMVSLGISLGVVGSGGIALAGELFPDKLRTSGMAISMTARSIGQMTLPSLMGGLLGAGRPPAMAMFLLALILLFTTFAAATLRMPRMSR